MQFGRCQFCPAHKAGCSDTILTMFCQQSMLRHLTPWMSICSFLGPYLIGSSLQLAANRGTVHVQVLAGFQTRNSRQKFNCKLIHNQGRAGIHTNVLLLIDADVQILFLSMHVGYTIAALARAAAFVRFRQGETSEAVQLA